MPETKAPYGGGRAPKDERIAVRATREERELISHASAVAETTVSDFVLRASLNRAAELLADRREFRLPPDQWEEFLSLLEQPPVDQPRLRQLLTTPSVLERPSPGT
jgi:uncharacterized protein (DUF1778 family)